MRVIANYFSACATAGNFFCALIFLALSGVRIVMADPIAIRNQYPLAAIHLSLKPQAGIVLKEGESAASFLGSWGNTFNLADDYMVDSENLDGRFEIQHGIGDGTEVSFSMPVVWRGGGRLDSTLDGWHQMWGMPRGDRHRVPDNRFDISGQKRDGDIFSVDDEGGALGNPVFGIKRSLFDSSDMSSALFFEASAPAIGDSYAHDGIDLMGGVAVTRPLSWTTLHFGGALVWMSDDEYQGIPYEQFRPEGFLNTETQLFEKFTLLVGVYGGGKTLDGITGYPDYFTYLDIGGRIACGDGISVVVNLRENPIPQDSTTDVTFSVGVEGRW